MPHLLHRGLFALVTLLVVSPTSRGQSNVDLDPVLVERADKIVRGLGLENSTLATRIRVIVAAQYAALRPIHEARDASIATAQLIDNPEARAAAIQTARDIATARQSELHYAFLATLAAELTPPQVDAIKDGMTYGVLPNTFKVYQEMLPDLSPAQRGQILAWLIEAREHAMDAGTSKDKHAWFGKYKGRINNYLAKAGYDMKQAEQAMFARQKSAREASAE